MSLCFKLFGFAGAVLSCVGAAQGAILQATSGPYELSITDPVAVAESTTGLMEAFLVVTNVSGDAAANAVGFNGTIGANGGLHHEQFAAGPNRFPTPTVADGGGVLDSYFTTVPTLAIAARAETNATVASGETGKAGGVTGYGGVLSGNVAYASASVPAVEVLQLARLVFNPTGTLPNYSFNITTPDITAAFSGTLVLGGTAVDPVAIGNPVSGSSISLQGAFNDGTGLLANAITLTNGEPGSDPALSITDLVISDDAEGLFGATFNGLNIDLTIDVDAARNGPKRNVSALLTVNTNGGVLTYNLGARVPEPSTVALSALALVGLVGFARRKK